MEDRHQYIQQLIKIREGLPMSWREMASELNMSYDCLKRFMDEEANVPAREFTIRKIKALVNKYKDSLDV